MNSLDLVLLIIMVVSIAIGSFRGGIREIFSLASVILGFIVAMNFYQQASGSFLRLTEHAHVNEMIAFVGIFIVSAVLISFIGGRLSQMVRKTGLLPLNTMLGTAVGALRGIVISALVVYAVMVFISVKDPIITKSKSFPYMTRISDMASPIATSFFKDEFSRKLKELEGKGAAVIDEQKDAIIEPLKPAGKKTHEKDGR